MRSSLKHSLTLVSLTLILSCSVLEKMGAGAVQGALGTSKQGGIELDAQIGDKETKTNLQTSGTRGTGDVSAKGNAKVNVNSESSGTKFDNATGVNIKNENIPLWVILVLILGWVLPDPMSMWRQSFGKGKK